MREVERLRPFETVLGEHLKHRFDALRVIQAAERSGKFVFTDAKRLLQQYLPIADIALLFVLENESRTAA